MPGRFLCSVLSVCLLTSLAALGQSALDGTRGHSTHTAAAAWKNYLAEFMLETEPKP